MMDGFMFVVCLILMTSVFMISSSLDSTLFSMHTSNHLTWGNARAECEKEAKKLLRIQNLNKWNELLLMDETYAKFLTVYTYWIGLRTYSTTCQDYMWGGYEPHCNWYNWGTEQPAGCDTNQCVKVVSGQWSTANCEKETHAFICERVTTTNCEVTGGLETTTLTTTTENTQQNVIMVADSIDSGYFDITTTQDYWTTPNVDFQDSSTISVDSRINGSQVSSTTISVTGLNGNQQFSTTSPSIGVSSSLSVISPGGNSEVKSGTTAGPTTAGYSTFNEHADKTIVESAISATSVSPLAVVHRTGDIESCLQTCLDSHMNSLECWAVLVSDITTAQCVLYYIDDPDKLTTATVLVSASGSTVFIKTQSSSPADQVPCQCRVMNLVWGLPSNMSVEELLELLEKRAKLRRELAVLKNNTKRYQRSLVSVYEKRASAMSVGAIGIALLVGFLGFFVAADIGYLVSFMKSLIETCKRKDRRSQA